LKLVTNVSDIPHWEKDVFKNVKIRKKCIFDSPEIVYADAE
jgi:hypothetical protein